MGCVGGVASPPENRRKGYVADMLTKALYEMINHLAPIVTGFISPAQVYKLNHIKKYKDKVIKELQQIFTPRKTYLEFFRINENNIGGIM